MDQYHSKSKHNPTNEFKDSMYTKRKMQEAIRGHLWVFVDIYINSIAGL